MRHHKNGRVLYDGTYQLSRQLSGFSTGNCDIRIYIDDGNGNRYDRRETITISS